MAFKEVVAEAIENDKSLVVRLCDEFQVAPFIVRHWANGGKSTSAFETNDY